MATKKDAILDFTKVSQALYEFMRGSFVFPATCPKPGVASTLHDVFPTLTS